MFDRSLWTRQLGLSRGDSDNQRAIGRTQAIEIGGEVAIEHQWQSTG
ncbi:hypothetical protein H6F46_17355 [Limnothrix sp. FACHB-1083]|nr:MULTISPECIES: hypothetical protein [unclassified Limnothrix]MBD2162460.1 hypothetical protein [Limnothrix sp. FACHB-1083]MBD2193475.1 hypothetical protein [Limnothrix sp. FACHB-1088]